ncbi:hypothetical protein HAHE_38490 [Haloferula helveola]|uniref:CorA-like Mg2+ transporter protein n=1 Tax=Haloferula helveola TaxID=490095 RepID=A0ABM7RIV1_9BACT|nr:hypothetical protein HAHE_38490 [Haloferula helveola]
MERKRARSFLPEGFELEDDLADQLSNRSGGQRYVEGETEALMILHEVPQPKIPEREPIVFWRKGSGKWHGPDGEESLRGISRLLDRYQEAIDRHEATIDETEEITEVFSIIRHAGPIARATRNMATVLEKAAEADEDNRTLRGHRDRVRDLQRAAELLYQDAKLTLDFWQAESAEEHQQAAERSNVIAFRLNLMAGFFLPLVAVAGLLGMNVAIPDFLMPWFWAIISSGLVLGLIVLFIVGWEGVRRNKK